MERKLAAILAADVVGYSRLMGIDEEGTLKALTAHREVVDGLIVAHHGRVFSSAGDSVVAEFPSAVEAINCAVEIQQGIAERNEPVPKDRRLEFRIGINIGDVMAERGSLFGDGVNVAARIQELAAPGGICVARNVYDQVRQKVGMAFESLGEHRVKNIAEPVMILRVMMDATAAPSRVARRRFSLYSMRRAIGALALVLVLAGAAAAAWHFYSRDKPAASSVPAIAVLPFDNLSRDADLDYFSDGATEDIITMLSRSPELTVMARNSSFVYKGKAVDVRQIGRELGVQYVLEGSVRKDADKVRIVAQLIDARNGQHVWAERFDGANSDPWVLQDDVAAKIVASLGGDDGQVRRAEYKVAWGKDTANLEEYDYYLRGHEMLMRFTKEGVLRAGEIWREGLAKFPDSSLLRVKLGSAYVFGAWNLFSDDAAEDYRRGGELIRQGLAAPDVSPKAQQIAHWMLAYVCAFERDFGCAEAEAQMALKLAPFDATMLNDLASVQIMTGHPEVALEWAEKAAARDPGNREWINGTFGWAYLVQGEYEKAIVALKAGPRFSGMRLTLAIAYVRVGRLDDAKAAVQDALALEPSLTQAAWRNVSFYSDPSITEREVADLDRAGLPQK